MGAYAMNWKPLTFFSFPCYAQTPTPLVLDDLVRVYFSERDGDGKSFISYADLDIDDPTLMLRYSQRILSRGKFGAFDQDGQMPSCAVRRGDGVVLYYSGWLALANGAYHNATGVAVSLDGGSAFERAHDGPLLDRTPEEPYLAVTPHIVGDQMRYIRGTRWEMIDGRLEPIYEIAEALYGFEDDRHERWHRGGRPLIEPRPWECFSRPWFVQSGPVSILYYSYRSAIDYRDGPGAYKIGYAVSGDGNTWTRMDRHFNLPRSDFDQTMQCYFATFEAKGKLYGVYNGNTFGKHGFGVAICE